MTLEEKLMKAKVQLLMAEPFFATLLLNMEHQLVPNVGTACTNGKVVMYDPEFIEKLDMEQLKFVIAHEVMHPAMFHHTRRDGRESDKWNRACDYPINELLYKAGFDEAKNWLFKPEYFGMSAEQIYDILPDQPEDGEPKQRPGDVEDSPAEDESKKQEEEAKVKQTLSQAMDAAEMAGNIPAGMERFVEEQLEPKIPWQEVLARFLSEIAKNDYSWSRPNVRYLQSGFILPSLYNEEVGQIIMIVDTSMSIDQRLLDQFGGEMQDILNTFNVGFTVLYVDTEVAGIQEVEPDGPVKLKPSGGGGTDFKPGFEYIQENDIYPRAVVYFTDGYCYSYPQEPDYPVLWAVYRKKNFNPPFGEVVKID